MPWTLFALLLLQLAAGRAVLDIDSCQGALGMESGLMGDDRMLASSSFDQASVGAQFARVRVDRAGGAWCPERPIDRNSYEFLQINLPGVHAITAVETQGRHAGGQGKEYPAYYILEYRRPGGNGRQWLRYRSGHDELLIKGNVDTNTPVKIVLQRPLIADSVRFVPFSQHPRTTCMRVELYGCIYDDGPTSYSMPQGDLSADVYYDGVESDGGRLTGGVGLLTDGRTDNFVSWNRGLLEMEFSFDRLRNFSAIQMYLSQLRRPCREMRVSFSADGQSYHSTAVLPFHSNLSLPVGQPGWLNVALPRKCAVSIKVQFDTGGKLLQIAEVRFVSEAVNENLTITLGDSNDGDNQRWASFVTDDPMPSGQSTGTMPLEYAALVCGIIGGCLVLLVALMLLLRHRKRNRLPAYSDFKSLPVTEHIAVDLKRGQTRVISHTDSWSPFLPATPRAVSNTYAFDQKPLLVVDRPVACTNAHRVYTMHPPAGAQRIRGHILQPRCIVTAAAAADNSQDDMLHYATSELLASAVINRNNLQ